MPLRPILHLSPPNSISMPTPVRKAPTVIRIKPGSTAEPAGVSPKPATVEYINIGLMLVAFVVASLIPFELFLFAYAVLGPLHYATEISWLYDRRFFAPRHRRV